MQQKIAQIRRDQKLQGMLPLLIIADVFCAVVYTLLVIFMFFRLFLEVKLWETLIFGAVSVVFAFATTPIQRLRQRVSTLPQTTDRCERLRMENPQLYDQLIVDFYQDDPTFAQLDIGGAIMDASTDNEVTELSTGAERETDNQLKIKFLQRDIDELERLRTHERKTRLFILILTIVLPIAIIAEILILQAVYHTDAIAYWLMWVLAASSAVLIQVLRFPLIGLARKSDARLLEQMTILELEKSELE